MDYTDRPKQHFFLLKIIVLQCFINFCTPIKKPKNGIQL